MVLEKMAALVMALQVAAVMLAGIRSADRQQPRDLDKVAAGLVLAVLLVAFGAMALHRGLERHRGRPASP
jgi:hypothetical protein